LCLAGCGDEGRPYQPEYTRTAPASTIEYIFAPHPLLNAQKLAEVYGAMLDHINTSLAQDRIRLKLEASRSYAAYNEKLLRREVHFALPNPYQTVLAQDCGYLIFGKADNDEMFRGVIILRKDSPIRTVQGLKGATVSFPAPTALAATITAVLTRVLDLEQGYWAVFSSILVMQAHIGGSIAASWARLVGTAAGALLGALAATAVDALLGQGMGPLAVAMGATIFFCALLAAKNENLRLAGLTAAVVICLHEAGGPSAFSIGLSRFLEVGLGIVVALAVSLAWPSRARVVLRFGLGKGLEQLAALLQALMDCRMKGRYDRQRIFHLKDAVLRLSLRNRQLFSSARREPGSSGQGELLATLLAQEERLAEHLLAMDHAIENAPAEGFHQHLSGELTELGAALAAGLNDLAQDLRADATPPLSSLTRLSAALDASGLKLLDLRQQRIIAVYDLDEVMHFYSFYNGLREAARILVETVRRLQAES